MSPESDSLIQLSMCLTLLLPSFVTNMLIVSDWMSFMMALTAQLCLGYFIHILKLKLGLIGTEQMNMPEFSFFWLILLVCAIALYTTIFTIFEKLSKERFVINQSN